MARFSHLALLLLGAIAARALGACPIKRSTVIAVYRDQAGGVGDHSAKWTTAFFDWLSAANSGLDVAYVDVAADLFGCSALATYDNLVLWVQPGGEADNQSVALGPTGRDMILDFAASPQGHIYATCAGWYYSVGSYWWYSEFFGRAWMPHWYPTVEGPITAIAAYPNYAPTKLSNGLSTIYYGGPALGLNVTTAALPNGTEVLAYYDHEGVPANVPAIVRYTGPFVNALFSSPHPEATSDDLTCPPPAPPGCITAAEQLKNWQFIAKALNEMLGTSYDIPSSL